MLSIPVKLYCNIVAVHYGIHISGLHRAPNAKVLKQRNMMDSILPAN